MPDRTKRDGERERDPLAELRSLLVAPERRELAQLQQRVDDIKLDARAVSPTLYGAIRMHDDPVGLGKALTPAVEAAIRQSVGHDRRTLSHLLYPIIGPAIRQALQGTLRAMMQSLNQILDHSLSPHAIGWRIEALRTGRTFAEVVLLNTLEYRVEELFLIEQPSGLLLQHVGGGEVAGHGDVVSGMLTAIQDFVRDSFGQVDTLGTMQIGDLTVWIEAGPRALLAAVIRGTPPSELRATLADTVAQVHLVCAEELESGEADSDRFTKVRPDLEACLHAAYATPSSRPSPVFLIVALVALLATVVCVGLHYRQELRWAAYTAALRATPGIVVTDDGKHRGRRFVSGLRDPLAADPAALLRDYQFDPAEVRSDWQPFIALAPELVAIRVVSLLDAPATIELTVADNVVRATGRASRAWIDRAQRLTDGLFGTLRFDATAVVDLDAAAAMASIERAQLEMARSTRVLEQLRVVFAPSSAALSAVARATIDEVAVEMGRLRAAATTLGRSGVGVELLDPGDVAIADHRRRELINARMELVVAELVARGVDRNALTVMPTADHRVTAVDAIGRDPAVGDIDASHRVSFRVRSAP